MYVQKLQDEACQVNERSGFFENQEMVKNQMLKSIAGVLFCACVVGMSLGGAGCSSSPQKGSLTTNSPLTHGNVQLTLKKGTTTQTEVIEKFGAPNIATIDSTGREVWTYQKHATVGKESSGYGTLIIIGGGSSGFEQSSKTITLIIKFDSKKVVEEFNSMSSSF